MMEKLIFKITDTKSNGLAADIDKMIKKEQTKIFKRLKTAKNKQD